jgi:glutamate-ammonia-ligase adenylyltransferase
MRQVQGLLRLMAGDDVDEDQAPDGLKAQLAHACGARDFDDLRARVLETAARVRQIFDRHIGGVAERPNTDNPMEHAGP